MSVIYIIGALIALFVIIQSSVFLVRALKRAKAMNIEQEKIKKVCVSSGVFAIVPSIPIIAGLALLIPVIGMALGWIRLTVIGSFHYELMVAQKVQEGITTGLLTTGGGATGALATTLLMMTISILSGLLGCIFILPFFEEKLTLLRKKNKLWMEVLTMSMFMGLIAVLGGLEIAKGFIGIGRLIKGGSANYLIHLLVLLSSGGFMAIFGVFIMKFKQKWLEGFALPLSMFGAILMAYVFVWIF